MSAETWRPFGVDDREFDDAPARNGTRVLNVSLRQPRGEGTAADRAATWLRAAMAALGLLAAAAAVVSFEAQYRMVFAAKHVAPIAALEAAIPDVAALVFASLGIALALHGRQAIRARVLNVGAVATSIAMNMLAAGHGFRDLAIWVMPPVAYALASDTAIGVIRSHAIARQRELREALAGDETTPLAVLGGFLLWVLRLALDRSGTWRGFRAWVVDSCPVAPGATPAAVIAASEEASRAIEATAQDAEAQVAAARAEAGERIAAAIQGRDQAVAAAQRQMDEAFARAQASGQQAALAQQAAEAVRGELHRAREAAERQVSQLRQDAARERDELRDHLARARETAQAPGEEHREVTQERDRLQMALAAQQAAPPAGPAPRERQDDRRPRGESKTARFLALVKDRHGELAGIDPAKVSRICSELAPEVELNEGSARSALRPLVLAANAGDQS